MPHAAGKKMSDYTSKEKKKMMKEMGKKMMPKKMK